MPKTNEMDCNKHYQMINLLYLFRAVLGQNPPGQPPGQNFSLGQNHPGENPPEKDPPFIFYIQYALPRKF